MRRVKPGTKPSITLQQLNAYFDLFVTHFLPVDQAILDDIEPKVENRRKLAISIVQTKARDLTFAKTGISNDALHIAILYFNSPELEARLNELNKLIWRKRLLNKEMICVSQFFSPPWNPPMVSFISLARIPLQSMNKFS
jgi:hypothetical protein